MFCEKCGNKIENGLCPNCNKGMVKLVIHRQKRFVGCAIGIKAYVDQQLLGVISNDGTIETLITPGKHQLLFDVWSATNSYDIEVPACSTFYVEMRLKMGLLKNNFVIESTRSE
jgi:ssDNA-binding Zn-finger/Zn-ribbon topoisomerase 1